MNKLFVIFCTSLLLFTATTASARPREQPFRLRMTPVDPKTHRPRSVFIIGEPVTVRVSLTNLSRFARTITQPYATTLPVRLSSWLDYENGPDIYDGSVGIVPYPPGTVFAETRGDMTIWLTPPERKITIGPGQTISIIFDVNEFHSSRLQPGRHTLTGKFKSNIRAGTSFRVVLTKQSGPLLEKLIATPVKNGDDSAQRWAKAYLSLLRQPSITGRIVDTDGRPLKEIMIDITGTEKTNVETRNDGRYQLGALIKGGTYTLTPSLRYYDHPGEERYTIEPASRTISNIKGNVTVNFTATRIRFSKNVASREEGATTKASSVRDDADHLYEPETIIDGDQFLNGGAGYDGWKDGTPNKFPDWIEVDFAGTHRINRIDIFTVTDDYKDRNSPVKGQKFSKYGITDFDVQFWTGRGWRTVPGGAIRGNREAWRMIKVPAIPTDKLRVLVRNALGGTSWIAEIEAYHLNELPLAKIIAGAKGHTNAPVQFRTETSDRDGSIRNYTLDFGDKSDPYEWSFNERKSGPLLQLRHSHVYEKEGTYEVTLRVVDDNDEASETKFTVTITDPPKF